MSTIASISAINGSRLDQLDPAPLPPDHRVYVQSVRDWFRLDKTSTATADGISIITASGGTGRWFRCGPADPSWLLQPAWVIDPSGGNDENTGVDSVHAIKTYAEHARRWGMQRGKARVDVAASVTIASSLPAGDIVSYDIELGPSGSFAVTGMPATVASGTFTDVTAINRATQTMQSVADTGLAGGWASHVNQFILITSGARAGFGAWVAKDLGGSSARTSRWAKRGTTALTPSTSAPQVGDPYQLVTLPTITADCIRVTGFDQSASQRVASFTGLDIVNRDASSRVILGGNIRSMMLFVGCSLSGIHHGSGVLSILHGSRITTVTSPTFESGCTSRMYASLLNQFIFVSPGALVRMDVDTIVQAAPNPGNVELNGTLEIGTAAIFDMPTFPLLINGIVRTSTLVDGTDLLWGTNNTGEVRVASLGAIEWATKPTVNAGAGIGNEVNLGGASVLWSDTPLTNPGNGAAAVQRQV